MQVKLSEQHRLQPYAKEAEDILRRCVHCGFCNATCPTFQLLGDELDGPRGRIYLIKKILEGAKPTATSRKHLDRCLTCQSCETTCPSGVQYSRLLETGRQIHDDALSRPLTEKWLRIALRKILLKPTLFRAMLTVAHSFSFLLSNNMKKRLPPLGKVRATGLENTTQNDRTLIMLRGCAQQVCAPEINDSASTLFSQLGFAVVTSTEDRCCGALSQHNDATDEARELARKNIDAWWPLLQQGAEAIVLTASGCATMVREYAHLLADDDDYADKARRVAEICRDPVEILDKFTDKLSKKAELAENISYQAPCTQQHGLGIRGRVEALLNHAGFVLMPQKNGHLCCGSAGSYSVTQPALSKQLKANKLEDLSRHSPALIATGNIGCLLHLQSATDIPVKHWLQLIDVQT